MKIQIEFEVRDSKKLSPSDKDWFVALLRKLIWQIFWVDLYEEKIKITYGRKGMRKNGNGNRNKKKR